MTPLDFLIINLALGFIMLAQYGQWKWIFFDRGNPVGVDFHTVQEVHWKKLPYWIFTPVALALIGSIALFWYHPVNSPVWAIWGVFILQVISLVLTAIFWGQWQAKLSKDPLGSQSPYLAKILRTHWARTLLINLYAFILLVWVLLSVR